MKTPWKHHLKAVNIQALDKSVVDFRKMRGMDDTIWILWGNRTYPRNSRSDGGILCYFLINIGFIALAVTGYNLLPFKYFSFMIILSLSFFSFLYPAIYAHHCPYTGLLSLLIGFLGLIAHPHFGFTIFGYNLEPYLFSGCVIGGFLGIYRRFWNSWIWRELDRITLRYYVNNHLPLDEPIRPIKDYVKAFKKLSRGTLKLIKYLTPYEDQIFAVLLENQTENGLENALALIDRRINEDFS